MCNIILYVIYKHVYIIYHTNTTFIHQDKDSQALHRLKYYLYLSAQCWYSSKLDTAYEKPFRELCYGNGILEN